MLRSFRVRVVLVTLRSVIFADYDVSAGNGHASFKALETQYEVLLA
jgi:hypothetical protein